MRESLSLNGTWAVTWSEGLHGRPEHAAAEEVDRGRYVEVQVPGELHCELVKAGLLEDPNVGLGSLKARWVEEQMWAYRREFQAPPAAAEGPAWLRFEGLDLNAVIFLNGQEVGRHANAHRPCLIPVTGKLRPDRNLVAVSLESGLYDVAERPGRAYSEAPDPFSAH